MERLTNLKPRSGFTLVEIMIVVAIIALLAAIAIPNVLRGRTTANESAAIGNLRALVSSVEMYRSVGNTYPNPAASWLAQMYGDSGANCATEGVPTPDFGPPSFCNAMAASLVQGYNYTYGVGATAGQTYTVNVWPGTVGSTGTRGFFLDESGLIRHCTCGTGQCTSAANTATVASATIDAAPNATCP